LNMAQEPDFAPELWCHGCLARLVNAHRDETGRFIKLNEHPEHPDVVQQRSLDKELDKIARCDKQSCSGCKGPCAVVVPEVRYWRGKRLLSRVALKSVGDEVVEMSPSGYPQLVDSTWKGNRDEFWEEVGEVVWKAYNTSVNLCASCNKRINGCDCAGTHITVCGGYYPLGKNAKFERVVYVGAVIRIDNADEAQLIGKLRFHWIAAILRSSKIVLEGFTDDWLKSHCEFKVNGEWVRVR